MPLALPTLLPKQHAETEVVRWQIPQYPLRHFIYDDVRPGTLDIAPIETRRPTNSTSLAVSASVPVNEVMPCAEKESPKISIFFLAAPGEVFLKAT
jgi:hypothetical protein